MTVSTRRLDLLEGGSVASIAFKTGAGGTVTVDVLDSIEVIGRSSVGGQSSLVAVTLGTGDAGQLTVNTSRLAIRDGGAVSTSTGGSGNAGSVTINARDLVEIKDQPLGTALPSYIGSAAPISPQSLREAFGLPDRPSGNSGSLTINTPRLSISNGADISVSNDGTGRAGILQVNANSISLDRGSSITAATASGEGGNIDLNVRDFLLLQNNSQITTSAGGKGGNIQIGAGTIATIPNENSDIRANSVNARGGNISINASGIFGTQFRPQDTPLSDITATGANSASNGTVQLNIEQPNPTFGLVDLPTTVVDPSRLIAQGCPATQGNSFIISGRGGLPPTPEQQLDDDADWQDHRRLTVAQQPPPTPPSQTGTRTPSSTPHPPILEATGWQITPTGEVFLVDTTLAPTVENQLNQTITCEGKQ